MLTGIPSDSWSCSGSPHNTHTETHASLVGGKNPPPPNADLSRKPGICQMEGRGCGPVEAVGRGPALQNLDFRLRVHFAQLTTLMPAPLPQTLLQTNLLQPGYTPLFLHHFLLALSLCFPALFSSPMYLLSIYIYIVLPSSSFPAAFTLLPTFLQPGSDSVSLRSNMDTADP